MLQVVWRGSHEVAEEVLEADRTQRVAHVVMSVEKGRNPIPPKLDAVPGTTTIGAHAADLRLAQVLADGPTRS